MYSIHTRWKLYNRYNWSEVSDSPWIPDVTSVMWIINAKCQNDNGVKFNKMTTYNDM